MLDHVAARSHGRIDFGAFQAAGNLLARGFERKARAPRRMRFRDANIGAYLEKAALDWFLGGATPTRPAAWGVGLSVGTPSSTSGSEIATGSGYTRQTATFNAAASPAGSASNANAMTFGPFSTGCTVIGLQVWDTTAATSGNMLLYGTLATARTLGAGDSLVINAGALTVTLS